MFNIQSLLNLFKIQSKRYIVSHKTSISIEKDWSNVEVMLKQKGPSQLRQALIVADKSLDLALSDIVEGNNLGERLKNAKDRFDYDTYNKIWEAHKLRNSIVHEVGFDAPVFMVQKSIDNLKRALKTLGVRLS